MFPIDTALLPSLSTRKALLVVDPQNDFLTEDGALPVKIPSDLPFRIADFANAFRQRGGDVIWVRSQFDSSRPVSSEQILTSDGPARGRRSRPGPHEDEYPDSPEAFLTLGDVGEQEHPSCVRPGSRGLEFHPVVQLAVGPRDHQLVKSHYSAFKSEQLLRLLRTRVVTELFICGAMTNISVMATAIDAASHGYTITIVDDCCGYQSIGRHRAAIMAISDTTGCQTLRAARVLESMAPKLKPRRSPDRRSTEAANRYPTVRPHEGREDGEASPASVIQSSFERLSLSGDPAADKPELRIQPQESKPPLQPMAEHKPDIEKQPNRAVLDSNMKAESRVAHSTEQCTGLDNDQSPRQRSPIARAKQRPDKESGLMKGEQTPILDETSDCSLPKVSFDSDDTSTPLSRTVIDSEQREGDFLVEKSTNPINTTNPTNHSTTVTEEISSTMAHQALTLGESSPLCEGDTKVIYDVLPQPLAENIFERVRDEVLWQRMSHQGGEVPRLVAVQGLVAEDGTMPVYRHPADESPPLLPFSATVAEIKMRVEEKLGHPLNHVLIQFYRHGNDYISEHSDKTLDIAKGTFIANVSLGAERTMTFRTKRQAEGAKRQIQRARLPHNSLCRMGLTTNMRWLHAIRQDKRMDRDKSPAELAFDGGRISLTFRQIATFLDRDGKLIWGQGAEAKTQQEAHRVINGQTPEAVRMLRGFGRENQSTDFDWDEFYGEGFDVLHMSTAPRLFLSTDPVVNMRVQMMLAEFGINYARGSVSPHFNWKDGKPTQDPVAIPVDLPVKFVDNDESKTIVAGQLGIMLYLQRVHDDGEEGEAAGHHPTASRPGLGRLFERFQQALSLLDKWRACPDNDIKLLRRELTTWDRYAGEGDYIAGNSGMVTLADFAFWPVLHAMMPAMREAEGFDFENLQGYYERIKARAATGVLLDTAAQSDSP
ncbi:Uu.00g104440.m01.CDS01 [Anthostomella pinea]|uniref:Uu.00g104440.m01.CDS01 n=1 Tax=Anthostomella pinea TaxID=933095 RepID=A0AAI8V8N7_9PEZI|nr:Uu.00g104440.m01.CDS01 [Anthostomella pinea]